MDHTDLYWFNAQVSNYCETMNKGQRKAFILGLCIALERAPNEQRERIVKDVRALYGVDIEPDTVPSTAGKVTKVRTVTGLDPSLLDRLAALRK